MVFQLKTMSSHHWRAGRAKCTMPAGCAVTFLFLTCTVIFSPQQPHEVTTQPSVCNMLITPNPSQMQLPYQLLAPPECSVTTTNGVGTAERGFAIKTSPVSRCSTSM